MKILSLVLSAAALLCAGSAWSQSVHVEGAWARATVPGQKATGAFMTLTAPEATQLVGASSPAAGVTEVHEMAMQGDVMRMRAIDVLPLPAGQAVTLKPGGYHIMLLDLKAPLAQDSAVPLTLRFKDARGQESRIELQVPVRAVNTGAPAAGAAHGHKH
jgi:copper(I)-binding protein